MDNKIKCVAVAVVSIGAGAAMGYLIAKKKFEKQTIAMLDELEVTYKEALADYSARMTKTGPYSSVEEASAVLIPSEALKLYLKDDAIPDPNEE